MSYNPASIYRWQTNRLYAAQDVVCQGINIYLCNTSHTSGTFLTDVAAGKWIFIGNGIVQSRSSNYTATLGDCVVKCDATSAAFTVTTPTAVGNDGYQLTIIKADSSANAVSVDANSTETINGNATALLLGAQWDFLVLRSDGTNWIIVSEGQTCSARYTTAAGNSVSNATLTYVDFGTKSWDTQGAVSGAGGGNKTTTNTGWKYTVTKAGKYQINAALLLQAYNGWAANEEFAMSAIVNGTIVNYLCDLFATGTASSINVGGSGSCVVNCAVGDRIEIGLYQGSGTAISLATSAANNFVDITWIGR